MASDSGKSLRGFAAMPAWRRREIASHGGSVSGGNFKKDRAKASRAGKVGGKRSRRTSA